LGDYAQLRAEHSRKGFFSFQNNLAYDKGGIQYVRVLSSEHCFVLISLFLMYRELQEGGSCGVPLLVASSVYGVTALAPAGSELAFADTFPLRREAPTG